MIGCDVYARGGNCFGGYMHMVCIFFVRMSIFVHVTPFSLLSEWLTCHLVKVLQVII